MTQAVECLSSRVARSLDQWELRILESNSIISGAELAERGTKKIRTLGNPDSVAATLRNDPSSVELVLGCLLTDKLLLSLPDTREKEVGLRKVGVAGECAVLVDGPESQSVSRIALGDRDRAENGALVQFTSGTVGEPNGVVVTRHGLQANCDAILDRLEVRAGDACASWLPLSHDMGLIGMFLTSVIAAGRSGVGETRFTLMKPSSFLRAPWRWLDSDGDRPGTITAAPDSALRHAVRLWARRPTPGRMAVRALIVGGEPVRTGTLSMFAKRVLEPSGIGPETLCAAYGLAECTLAVTLSSPTEPWAHGDSSTTNPPTPLVSCGSALNGISLEIADGELKTEGGSIRVGGPSIALSASDGKSLVNTEGFFDTNDIGRLSDTGELTVTGRTDDMLVVNGRNLSAVELEAAVGIEGVALVSMESGELVLVFENRTWTREATSCRTAAAVLAAEFGVRPDALAVVPARFPRTSSGKLKRRELIGFVVSSGQYV